MEAIVQDTAVPTCNLVCPSTSLWAVPTRLTIPIPSLSSLLPGIPFTRLNVVSSFPCREVGRIEETLSEGQRRQVPLKKENRRTQAA